MTLDGGSWRTKKNVLHYSFLLITVLVLAGASILDHVMTNVRIRSSDAIIIFDADMTVTLILVPAIYPVLAIFVSVVLNKREIIQSKAFRSTLVLMLLTALGLPFLGYRQAISSFADAGYTRCGRFLETRDVDKTRSIFPSRAWVLDASDCAEAEAHPPRAAR